MISAAENVSQREAQRVSRRSSSSAGRYAASDGALYLRLRRLERDRCREGDCDLAILRNGSCRYNAQRVSRRLVARCS